MPLSERQRLSHLLRRAGFGATPEELQRFLDLGYENTVEELLHPEKVEPDSQEMDDLFRRRYAELASFTTPISGQAWWVHRMLLTKAPLREKMCLFWHDHFATSYVKVKRIFLLVRQYETIRQHALGRFEDLVLAISRDPAMIIWLDNDTNRKEAPNENYARELFELFTLGIGHYTERDIQEAARAFTGWTYRGARFFFDVRQHDFGEKEVLGQRGTFNGEDIVALAVRHPATGRHLGRKLYQYFVADREPEEAAVETLARAYFENDFDLRSVMRTLFHAPFFLSEEAYYAKVKTPAEYVVGLARLLGLANLPAPLLARAMASMGQELFNPPNVGGWEDGPAWITTATLMTRINFAAQWARSPQSALLQRLGKRLAEAGGNLDPERIVDEVLEALTLEVAPVSREKFVAFAREHLTPEAMGRPRSGKERLVALVSLVLAAPEFQLA